MRLRIFCKRNIFPVDILDLFEATYYFLDRQLSGKFHLVTIVGPMQDDLLERAHYFNMLSV